MRNNLHTAFFSAISHRGKRCPKTHLNKRMQSAIVVTETKSMRMLTRRSMKLANAKNAVLPILMDSNTLWNLRTKTHRRNAISKTACRAFATNLYLSRRPSPNWTDFLQSVDYCVHRATYSKRANETTFKAQKCASLENAQRSEQFANQHNHSVRVYSKPKFAPTSLSGSDFSENWERSGFSDQFGHSDWLHPRRSRRRFTTTTKNTRSRLILTRHFERHRSCQFAHIQKRTVTVGEAMSKLSKRHETISFYQMLHVFDKLRQS